LEQNLQTASRVPTATPTRTKSSEARRSGFSSFLPKKITTKTFSSYTLRLLDNINQYRDGKKKDIDVHLENRNIIQNDALIGVVER
jgi:hypothetical protein